METKTNRRARLLCALTLCTACILTATSADYFVRASGTGLLGRDGKRIVLRGTNCGNWMVREPYMMNTSGNLDRQFKFDQMLAEVCGKEKVAEFDSLWMTNLFAEADMKFLASQGFNTLRVPMHYKYFTLPVEQEPVPGEQTWLQEGFARIDSMCVWAERHGMLLVLDMHACPGGQSSGDICDYDSSKPSLWESEANRAKLIALWRRIAQRYRDEKCVAAYDLINETNWTLPDRNKLLWDTFKAIIKAIREVDSKHLVILEGNSYSNDYTGLPSSKMDSKMMLQFHRYGVYNTKSQVQYMANLGAKYNCPVYIGEFGENSNSWTADAIRLYEEAMGFAGWTCWPMKKSGINCLLKVRRVASYDKVIAGWKNGTRPTASALWSACKAWAEAQNISKCDVRADYLDALLRRPYSRDCVPFGTYQTGDYIYAAHYDMGPVGMAYWDTGDASYQYSGEDFTNWQAGWTGRNDGVDLYGSPNDTKNCGYYVGGTQDGEWMQYTIENPNEPACWQFQLRYALKSGTSKVRVTVNDRTVVAPTVLRGTGGYTSWTTKVFRDIILPSGTLRVRVYVEKGGLNINWLRLCSMREATGEQLGVLLPDSSAGRNHLTCGECEFQGTWRTAALGSVGNTRLTWNTTEMRPSRGEGGALAISSARQKASNIVVYQPVDVVAGHIYAADVAVRGDEANKDFWIQAFMARDEPKDYADEGLGETNTIGQLNSWVDASLSAFDGMMSERAKAGQGHTADTMKWKANFTGTAYFALKVGSNKYPFSCTLDSFTLTDLTSIETAIRHTEASAPPCMLLGNNPVPADGCRIYNTRGQKMKAGGTAPGIYIIANGNLSRKVMVRAR
ncbi:MAG TPA: hypothetical protein DC006_04670 [Prevotellaceae bacterium]|nr:hypothetical protein [Prevotellaceae bacterium]